MGDKRWLFDGGLFAINRAIIVLSKSEKLLKSLCGAIYKGFLLWKDKTKMIKVQEINKICEGLEKDNKKTAIKKLIDKGYSKENAIKYYNIWRKHYVTTLINIS